MTTAAAPSAAVASTTVAAAAMPSISAMAMSTVGGTTQVDCRASATTSQVNRVGRPSVTARAEGAGIEPLCLLRSVSLVPGATQHMRIVVNHSAEQSIAVGGVLRRVKDVLMPELI